MTLTRRGLFGSAVALLALPRRVAAERFLGPVKNLRCDEYTGGRVIAMDFGYDHGQAVATWVLHDSTVGRANERADGAPLVLRFVQDANLTFTWPKEIKWRKWRK